MLRILARKGITKKASATPGEFARDVAQRDAWYQEDVRFLTELYYGVRFGSLELSQEDVTHVEALLQRMIQHTTA